MIHSERTPPSPERPSPERPSPERRGFLLAGTCMASGLVAGYGTFATMASQFLFPAEGDAVSWQFVARTDELTEGKSKVYVSPSGARVVVARQALRDEESSFVALSNICPHLGCQVHWEAQNSRFFCPCHNGAFDAQGRATEGPPLAANQQLTRFRLRIENGLLYVLVPIRSLTKEA